MAVEFSASRPSAATILLVGDEPSGLVVSRRMLERTGYEVLVAVGSHEAAQMYRDHVEEIELVILDVIMPQLGGREVFSLLRRLDQRVRVLMVTGACTAETTAAVLGDGVAAIVQKPYDDQALATAVRRVLGQVAQAPVAAGPSRRPAARIGVD